MPLPQSTRSSQRARLWAGIAALVVLLLLIAGNRAVHLIGRRANAAVQTPSAASGTFHLNDEQLRSVTIEPVAAMAFHSEEITDGKIAFNGDTLTPVYSPYSGRVTRLVAPLGKTVKRGETLFELQASEYAQAQSDLLSAAAQARLTAVTEQRRHAQYDAHGASLQDWQQSQYDLTAAQANLAAVRNRLHIFGKSDADIDAIAASGTADANVSAVAPINGVVVDRQIGPGQVLQAGASTPVYTIADLSTVWMVANVRESEAALVHVGQSVSVRVLAVPEREFSARLNYVGATVDATSRRVPVHAVLDNSQHLLKPEMFASFTIATSPDSMAPAVPLQAVIFEGSHARVWVMQSDHDAGLRELSVGRSHAGKLEVLRGLSVGERVITRGALFIDRAASGS
jgi:cobalt-zinc-cadmium efflux system membrane fusion protein